MDRRVAAGREGEDVARLPPVAALPELHGGAAAACRMQAATTTVTVMRVTRGSQLFSWADQIFWLVRRSVFQSDVMNSLAIAGSAPSLNIERIEVRKSVTRKF
jgi:hypothetical protein